MLYQNRVARLVCATALACAALAPAAAAPPRALSEIARAGIEASYGQISEAFVHRDLDRVLSYFTPDCTVVDGEGTRVDRDAVRRQYEGRLRQIKTIQSHWSILRLTPTPSGTWAEMRMHSDGTGEKRVLFARIRGTFTNDLWVRDLWVPTSQGWRLKRRQTLEDQTRTHPG